MNEETPAIGNTAWNAIFKSISNGKTILFLGPSIATNQNGISLQREFFENLYKEKKVTNEIISYNARDEFFVFNKPDEIALRSAISDFFMKDFAESIYSLIAEIPFHLIILVSPDMTLKRMFEKKFYSHNYNYFDYNKPRKIDTPPTKECPLIYNLFGMAEDHHTLILTHNNMFSYLENYYRQTVNNRALLNEIQQQFDTPGFADNLLFIGMDFNKWYMQWIIHELKINVADFQRFALDCSSSVVNKTLIEKQYSITFVNNNIEDFFNKILQYFKDENAKDPAKYKLRQPKQSDNKVYNTNNIVELLEKYFNDGEISKICMIHFDEVYSDFGSGMIKSKKIEMLVDYAEKHLSFDDLLKYCEEMNPKAYELFKPYWK